MSQHTGCFDKPEYNVICMMRNILVMVCCCLDSDFSSQFLVVLCNLNVRETMKTSTLGLAKFAARLISVSLEYSDFALFYKAL